MLTLLSDNTDSCFCPPSRIFCLCRTKIHQTSWHQFTFRANPGRLGQSYFTYMIAEAAKYSAWASSPNFVAINWTGACSARFPSIRAASCKQQRQHALSRSRLLHTSRPLNPFPLLHHAFTAAKASVFNRNFLDDVAMHSCIVSSVAVAMDFTKRRILQRFFQNAGLLPWRHCGFEGASQQHLCFVQTSPAEARHQKRWVQ